MSGDLAKAAELQHATIPRLEDELDAWDKKEHEGGNQHKMLSDFVSADAIATVVARHTGIPVSRITGSESRKLLKLEDQLRQRVVGQDDALSAVSDCVRLARTRLQAPDRPLGTFLFIGPTGVGKTELCKFAEGTVLVLTITHRLYSRHILMHTMLLLNNR